MRNLSHGLYQAASWQCWDSKNCARIYRGLKCFSTGIYPKEVCPWTRRLGEVSVYAVSVGCLRLTSYQLGMRGPYLGDGSLLPGEWFCPASLRQDGQPKAAVWSVQVGRGKERPSSQLPLPRLSTQVDPILHADSTICSPRSHSKPGGVNVARSGVGLLDQTNPHGLAEAGWVQSAPRKRADLTAHQVMNWKVMGWGIFFFSFFLTPFWFFSSLEFVKVGMSSFLGIKS